MVQDNRSAAEAGRAGKQGSSCPFRRTLFQRAEDRKTKVGGALQLVQGTVSYIEAFLDVVNDGFEAPPKTTQTKKRDRPCFPYNHIRVGCTPAVICRGSVRLTEPQQ